MFNGERPRSETPEEERNPERVINDAVSAVENEDATDPITSSEWVSKAKNFTKTSGKIAGISAGVSAVVPLILCAKILYGVFKFAKKAIEKKGQVGFSEGSKIGEEEFLFGDKNK